MTKRKGRRTALIITAEILLFILCGFFLYAGDYYRASDNAAAVIAAPAGKYTVESTENRLTFMPETPDAALIFYPGGKVEYTAYTPLMAKFAERGMMCVLLKMPFNLAVFDINAANRIRAEYPDIDNWYIGGHSLGGAMAASHIGSYSDKYSGLLLLGAYPTADLSRSGLSVISVYGSEDRVMNRKRYAARLGYMPEKFSELVIEGGCHAYFGDYGAQRNDGTPAIDREEQLDRTADFFIASIQAAYSETASAL